MLFTCIFLIASVFQTYEFYLLLSCFLKVSKRRKRFILLVSITFFILISVPYLVLNIPIVTLVCSYAGTLVFTSVFEGTWKIKIIAGTFAMGIMVLAECVIAIVSGYVNLNLIQTNEYYSLLGTVCLPVVEFMIVLVIRNFKNMKEGEIVSVIYWIISVTLPVISLYLFVLFYKQPGISSSDVLSCTILLFIINIFVFYLYDKQMHGFMIRQEKYALEMQNQYQLNQLELMHEKVEKSRSLRHDFLKHISMISYLNEKGNKEELSDYLKEIQGNVNSQHKYVDTGNFVFDSILNYKIQEAMEQGIRIDAKVKIPEKLKVSIYDMNVILTNLIDNSIEAVHELKNKKVEVEITYSKSRLNIYIKNPYETVIINEKGKFLTTKRNKEKHGYGLKNVKSIVDKYEGIMNIENKNNIFEVFICLFVE